MKILDLYKNEYCFGVKRALLLTKEHSYQNTYILGSLIHNSFIQEELKMRNFIEIDNIKNLEKKDKLIVTAHGTTDDIIKESKIKGITLIDATCPIIIKIKEKINDYLKKNYLIFYIGKKFHKETIGVLSISDKIILIEDINQIPNINENLNKNIIVLNQTTLNEEKLFEIQGEIKKKYPNALIENTICKETLIRQNILKTTKKLDLVIVVGDIKSSNCNELYKIAIKYHNKAIFISSKKDILDKDFSIYNEIGIISGTSTPNYIKEEIIDYLESK